MIYKIRKFEERFAAGKASMVADKVFKIVAKRIKDSSYRASIPLNYSNDYGIFEGYLAKFINNDLFVRINFLKGSSDSIFSYDVYLDSIAKPNYTIDVLGLNIVEIVDSISDSLIEDDVVLETTLDESITKPLAERGRPTKNAQDYVYMLEKWTDEDDKVLDILQRKSVSATYSKEWMSWVRDKPRYKEEVKYGMFMKMVKFFLLERGLTNKTFRKRKKGNKDRVAEDPILEAQFQEIVDSITWNEKFTFLKGIIGQVVAGNVRSVYLYGSPGSGKSYETVQTLDSLNANYKVYKGGVKSTDDLIRILYNNREDTILVFDDADSMRKNKDQNNILKAALEDGERIITYVDTKRANNKGMDDVPQQFPFHSQVIFISNDPKVDAALKSRSVAIEIDLSNADMVERMDAKLEAYRPDVDMKTKKEALEYAREISAGVEVMDFRMLDNILIAKSLGGNWKRMALLMVMS